MVLYLSLTAATGEFATSVVCASIVSLNTTLSRVVGRTGSPVVIDVDRVSDRATGRNHGRRRQQPSSFVATITGKSAAGGSGAGFGIGELRKTFSVAADVSCRLLSAVCCLVPDT